MAEEGNKIVLYTTDDGRAQVSLMSRDGRIWLNQKQMAELFAVTKPNISMLVAKIFMGKELDDSVVKSYFTTAADGKRYNVIYYALEMILAVGFRVRGVRGMQKGTRRSTTCGARRKRGLRTRRIWRNCDESRMRRNDAARMENADDIHCARMPAEDVAVVVKQLHQEVNKWIRSPQYSAAG